MICASGGGRGDRGPRPPDFRGARYQCYYCCCCCYYYYYYYSYYYLIIIVIIVIIISCMLTCMLPGALRRPAPHAGPRHRNNYEQTIKHLRIVNDRSNEYTMDDNRL